MADNVNCHKWISRKVKDYDRLLLDATLTPRLEERLEQARDIFASARALQDTNLLSLTRSLRKLDVEIEAIYQQTFGSIARSAELLLHLTAVRGFVRALLYDDYGRDPAHSVRRILNVYDFVVTGKIISGELGRAQVAKEYGRPEVDDPSVTETMRCRLRDCAREMLLDVDVLEHDLMSFAARSGQRRDRVRELVDRCRWAELAAKLEKDRLDLARIVPRRDRIGKYGGGGWHEEIFDRIQGVEEEWFESIRRPCRVNAKAKKMTELRRRKQRDEKRHAEAQVNGEQWRVTAGPEPRKTQSVGDVGKLLREERELPPVPYLPSRKDLEEIRRTGSRELAEGKFDGGVSLAEIDPRSHDDDDAGDGGTKGTMVMQRRRGTKADLLANDGDHVAAMHNSPWDDRDPSPGAPPRYSVQTHDDGSAVLPMRSDRALRGKERRSLPGLVSRLFTRSSTGPGPATPRKGLGGPGPESA